MATTATATAKKAATKKTTAKKQSAYAINVLGTNKALHEQKTSLGGALKILWFFRDEIKLPNNYRKIVKGAIDDVKIYDEMKKHVRKSKAGNYSPFFVLQHIHRTTK